MYKEKRPVLKIKCSGCEIFLEGVSIIAVLVNLYVSIKYYPVLPSIIPTHFGFSGEINSFGSKNTLFFLPILVMSMYILLTVLSRFPHSYNYLCAITEKNAEVQYQNARELISCLKAEIAIIFTFIQLSTIAIALGKANTIGVFGVPVFIFVVFGSIVYYINRSVKLNKKQ